MNETDTAARRADQIAMQPEFCKAVLDVLPIPVFYKDIQGRYLGCNSAYETFFGIKSGGLTGKTVYDIAPKDLADTYAVKDQELFDTPGTQMYESQVKDRHGVVHDVVFNQSTFRDNAGNVAGMVGMIQDITERKQVDRSLQASEAKYRMLVEHQGEGIVIADLDEQITYSNPAGEQIFGVQASMLTGRKVTEFVSAASAARLAGETGKRRRGERSKYELEIIQPCGVARTIMVTGVPQTSEDGAVIGTLAILQDVTDQIMAQKVIHINTEKYRSLFVNMINGFAYHRIVTDEAGQPVDYVFLEVNDAFERMTGLTSGDIIGKRMSEVMPDLKNDTFDWVGTYGRVALEGMEFKSEQFSQVLGKWFYVTAYSPAKGFFVTVFDDITERKKQESELRKLTTAVEQSANIVVITDLDANIIYVNQAFVNLTGYSREEAIGKNPRILKSGEMEMPAYEQMWQILLSGGKWRGEFHNKKKNGDLYWEQATITSIKDERGKPVFYMAVKEDITMRRALEEERERLIAELQDSLDNIKTLKGLVPICSSCKKIRDDKGYWKQVEEYVAEHTEADFSHGLCDECAHKLYPEYFPDKKNHEM